MTNTLAYSYYDAGVVMIAKKLYGISHDFLQNVNRNMIIHEIVKNLYSMFVPGFSRDKILMKNPFLEIGLK